MRKRIFFLLCGVIAALTGIYVCALMLLPSEISLRIGEQSTIHFRLPVQCEVVGENIAVVADNTKPITDNISKDVILKADNTDNARLKLSAFGIPLKSSRVNVLENTELMAGGNAIGLELETDGILVLGTGEIHSTDGRYLSPCKGKLQSGDLIKKAGNTTLTDKESLIEYIEKSTGKVSLTVERSSHILKVSVEPVLSAESEKRKLGLWVRDSTQGIGTLTCYDKSGTFYALGHPVTDVDTGSVMKIRTGKLLPTTITAVNMGQRGAPGELIGNTDSSVCLGEVYTNGASGILGKLTAKPSTSYPYKAALKSEVTEGAAQVLLTLNGQKVEAYNIMIESCSTLSTDKSKAMIIRITDEKLIKQTGGIVQGMSGAPIIQNGKIVGAITHVFIQNPTKGYGIYIEDMLK